MILDCARTLNRDTSVGASVIVVETAPPLMLEFIVKLLISPPSPCIVSKNAAPLPSILLTPGTLKLTRTISRVA